jgi:2-hydroxychromene-2-carboxylate isomerase
MGDLIDLAARRADRSRPSRRSPVAFFFDLSSPLSYVAAERVERALGDVEWIALAPRAEWGLDEWVEAERQAAALRLPLVWPEADTAYVRASRAAAYAASVGLCAPFALAASRLVFCGGFDLDDPEILAEAAAAAGIGPEESLAAAADSGWDAELEATSDGLRRRGVGATPAVRIGSTWLSGGRAIAEAAVVLQAASAGLQGR